MKAVGTVLERSQREVSIPVYRLLSGDNNNNNNNKEEDDDDDKYNYIQ